MTVRTFAGVVGAIYIVVGVLGFVPPLLAPPPPDAPRLTVDTAYGYLLGLFAVNILHTLVHLGVGVWGVVAARSWRWARTYALSLAIIFGVLTVMGLIPGLNTVFGLIPLFGHDVWLHAATALVAAYFATRQQSVAGAAAERERRVA